MVDSVKEFKRLTLDGQQDGVDLTPQQVTNRMLAALRKAHAMLPKEQKNAKLGKVRDIVK